MNFSFLKIKYNRLFGNFLSLSVLQVFTYIFPLVTFPYLVRQLGVEKFGIIVLAQSLMAFFNIFIDYGFNLSATRDIAIYYKNKNKLTEIFSSVLIIKIIMLLLSAVLLGFIILYISQFSNNKEIYLYSFLTVIGQAIFPVWYFQGIEKMKYITIVNISSKVIFTIAVFVVVRKPNDYIWVPVLNGLGSLCGGVYAYYILFYKLNQNFKWQHWKVLKNYFKDSTQFFISRLSVSIYTSMNTLILGIGTNELIVGYYAIAEKLYQAIQSLYNPITQILYPYVAKERDVYLFKKIFISVISVNLIISIFCYLYSDFIFTLFYHSRNINSESITVFNIFLIINLITVPSILLGYPFLGALGFANYANRSVIYGSLIHFLLMIFLFFTENINIYYVASAVVLTELTVLIFRVIVVRKEKLWVKQ